MYTITQCRNVAKNGNGDRCFINLVIAETVAELPTGGDISNGDLAYIFGTAAAGDRFHVFSGTTGTWISQAS